MNALDTVLQWPWRRLIAIAAIGALLANCAAAADSIAPVGAGSYATKLPAGAKGPQSESYGTERRHGPMPTNSWWSSLAWMRYSERHYPHPLAVEATPKGLRIAYPGSRITASGKAVMGSMPAGTGDDFLLGHSRQPAFPDARVDAHSDWFVAARFAADNGSLRATYGHGSPFVYAVFENGSARLSFPETPQVWWGDARSAVLGITIRGNHYGLFGPSGSTWQGLGGATLVNETSKTYFSAAILPDNRPQTLALFARYAHCHVTDTRASWRYESATAQVTTTLEWTTHAYEGRDEGTLFALYPHQWRHTDAPLLAHSYASVRGTMKLAAGKSLRIVVKYPGVLPALPCPRQCDEPRMGGYLQAEADAPLPPVQDTYWEGKWLGRMATLVPLAELHGQREAADALTQRIRQRLEHWFTAAEPDGKLKSRGLFYYEPRWGTLIGYPASYGSDVELNDHHFHYGYFIRAAAEVARRDPSWARDDRYGAMVKLLICDIASPDREEKRFPRLRCFDPYAGHSWACGHARFGDGNNQESSSEAMNAWYGLILWGEATGDRRLRDLGVWLYTTEMTAIHEYWYDVHRQNVPAGFAPSVVTMIWGGKGAHETWFSARPEQVHGINWLPLHGGSLYLGHYPGCVKRNYAALVREKGDENWRDWPDLIWMYRALAEPEAALAQFNARGGQAVFEAGNSRANAYHWIAALAEFGQVDASVTADAPLCAVFRKGAERTYAAWNLRDTPQTVAFSDGYRLRVEPRSSATGVGHMPVSSAEGP